MDIAEGQFSLDGPMPEHDVQQPTVEDQHTRQNDSARDITYRGVVQKFLTRVDELYVAGSWLQYRGGGLQHPCPQKDQEDPAIVS